MLFSRTRSCNPPRASRAIRPSPWPSQSGRASAKRGGSFLAAVCLAFAILATTALGCSVPVFRYALDRWPADAFRLEAPPSAFLAEPLAAEFRNLGGISPFNLEATRLPDASAESKARLLFPARNGKSAATAWSGELSPATFKTLVDSPGRAEVVARILKGDSAVWVLVESGNRETDEAAAALLAKRLRFIETAADLPPIDPNDPTSRLGPGPTLGVKLSLLRIRRDDPAEAAFIAMLAGPDGVGALPEDKPFGALVFGRGRVLGAWPGEKLTDEFIEEGTMFLLGSCSCEVKHLNPGWDLLVRVDWDAELEKAEQERIATANDSGENSPTPPAKPNASVKPETVRITPAATAAAAPLASRGGMAQWPLFAATATATLLFVIALFGKRRTMP